MTDETTEYLGADAERDLHQLEMETGAPPLEGAEVLDSQPAAPQIPTAELLAPLVNFGCNIACPNWKIQEAEKQALCDSYAAVIDKYFPEGLPMGPEFAAVLTTVAIFGPRIASRVPPVAPPKEAEPEGQADAA